MPTSTDKEAVAKENKAEDIAKPATPAAVQPEEATTPGPSYNWTPPQDEDEDDDGWDMIP
jgi:hypothetical protein